MEAALNPFLRQSVTMTDPTRNPSRRTILERLRSEPLAVPPLPVIDASRLTRFEDPVAKFVEMLTFVGGHAHLVESHDEIAGILKQIAEFQSAKEIVSLVPEAVTGNVDASQIDDPHALSSLDWVVAPGLYPVAENGAIWVAGEVLPHRVLLFIPQYLAIVVSRSEIVNNMHEAYAKVSRPPAGFGVFVSGPSKTADIEQSLVLGAHGCRTLQVFLTP